MKQIIAGLLFLLFVMPAHAAVCTWQGGTASWTNANTASWTCGHVPTSSDSVVFDGTSGGGTVTVNFGGLITVTSLDAGAFTGTLDFSANNNSLTATGSSGISFSGTGTRTINLGSGTFTVSNSTGGNQFSMGTTTNMTFNAGTSTIAMTGTGKQSFDFGNKTVNAVTIAGRSSGPAVQDAGSSVHTITSLTISPPNVFTIVAANTVTISGLSAVGTASNPIMIRSSSDETQMTISTAATLTCTYCSFRDVIVSGGGSLTTTSSLNLGNNTGITFGSGAACILGGWLLWRDMPEHLNDNFPAWLEKAA